jgi:hypothetical protein
MTLKFQDYLIENQLLTEAEEDESSGSEGSKDVAKDLALAARIATKLKMMPKLKVDPERSAGQQTTVTFRKMKLLQPSNMVVIIKSETISMRLPGSNKSKNVFSYNIFKIVFNGDVYVPSYLHGRLEKGSKIGTADEYLALLTNTPTKDIQPTEVEVANNAAAAAITLE